jgi:hypothetical protein
VISILRLWASPLRCVKNKKEKKRKFAIAPKNGANEEQYTLNNLTTNFRLSEPHD